MENEIWKLSAETKNCYEISSLGRIKHARFGRILKPGKSRTGYLQVYLSFGQHEHKYFSLHRLVAKAFIPNPYKLPEVNHKNGIKSDNKIENLEWVTRSDNQRHAFKLGLQQPFRGENGTIARKVKAYDLNGNLLGSFGCIIDAGKHFGLTRFCVSKIVTGKNKHTRSGLFFKYAD